MKHITFYYDVISPYAWLAFDKLPEALMGLSYSVCYQPVVLGAVLGHHGQLGPAEIAPKRDWTYRQVLWLAHTQGVALQMPASHPFNPLPLLRLAVACSPGGQSNRYVTERLFQHVWQGGADAADPQRLQALVQQLAPARDPNSDESPAKGGHRCGDRPGLVRRAGNGSGRQMVLGPGCLAHAECVPAWGRLVCRA